MFTRAMYKTADMIEQQYLLNRVSELLNEGVLMTAVNAEMRPINAKNLRQAHTMMERGETIGKIVLSDWV